MMKEKIDETAFGLSKSWCSYAYYIVRNMAGSIYSVSTTILETEWKPFFGGTGTYKLWK